jgi:hypothetical protein
VQQRRSRTKKPESGRIKERTKGEKRKQRNEKNGKTKEKHSNNELCSKERQKSSVKTRKEREKKENKGRENGQGKKSKAKSKSVKWTEQEVEIIELSLDDKSPNNSPRTSSAVEIDRTDEEERAIVVPDSDAESAPLPAALQFARPGKVSYRSAIDTDSVFDTASDSIPDGGKRARNTSKAKAKAAKRRSERDEVKSDRMTRLTKQKRIEQMLRALESDRDTGEDSSSQFERR